MQLPLVLKGFLAVALSCGILNASLTAWHENGLMVSLWLGFVMTILVGIILSVVYAIFSRLPGVLAVFAQLQSSVAFSIVSWCFVAFAAALLATILTNPDRLWDVRFYAMLVFPYGFVSGVAFWLYSKP